MREHGLFGHLGQNNQHTAYAKDADDRVNATHEHSFR